MLIDAGADVNHPVGQGSYTPLMLAATSGSTETRAATRRQKGANVNAKNPGGVTALMIAAAGNRTEIATLLIQSGADPNVEERRRPHRAHDRRGEQQRCGRQAPAAGRSPKPGGKS